MGLPSGLLWADRNIGANSPTEDGLYFSWGNTVGHPAGGLYNFSQDVYNSTPGAAINENLSLEHDAARRNLGTPWRMPTAAEFQELYDNCTIVWTSLNGVYGRLFTSNVNGKTLFFPAAGFYTGTSLSNHGTSGDYWASTYESALTAKILYFNSTSITPQTNNSRRLGFSVRAVADPSNQAQSLSRLIVPEHLSDIIKNDELNVQPIEPIIDSNLNEK